jgi:hypothetical protein
MYLDRLNDVEKVAFSRLAYLLISYYGIDDHEQKLFYSALGEMGLDGSDLEGEIVPAIEAAAFQSPAAKRIALLELLLLALADGDLEESEQNVLDVIIAEFSFDEDTLEHAWNWVRDWYQTYQSGNAFISMGDAVVTA